MSDAPHKVIKDALDDLAIYIDQEYPNRVDYPSEMRRYKRDMEAVTNARAALETLRETMPCPDCAGKGERVYSTMDEDGCYHEAMASCDDCEGTGRRVKL